jgi:heme-degrading monooxygenase HmoA
VGAEVESVTVASVLPLAVRPGAEDDLVRLFAELAVFEQAKRSGGFVGGRLLRPLVAGDPFLVMADWESADSYQGWLENPLRDELAARLEPLLAAQVGPGGLYEDA